MKNKEREHRYSGEIKEVYEFIQSKGYKDIIFISLYGSQNYGMETPSSDKDYKAVILPTLDDLIHNSQPVSTTLEFKGGQIDLKDIRIFTENICKMNPVYIETLYSPYSKFYKEDFNSIINERDELVKEMTPLIYKGAYGQILQKVKAFDHPFPSIKDKVEKYGYDPKQLHHIARLFFLMRDLEEKGKLVFVPENAKELMLIKTEPVNIQVAEMLRDLYFEQAKRIYDRHNDDKMVFNAKMRVISTSKNIIKNSIIGTIINQKEERK